MPASMPRSRPGLASTVPQTCPTPSSPCGVCFPKHLAINVFIVGSRKKTRIKNLTISLRFWPQNFDFRHRGAPDRSPSETEAFKLIRAVRYVLLSLSLSLSFSRSLPLSFSLVTLMLACASCAGGPMRTPDYASRQSLRTASRCQNVLARDRKHQHGGPCLLWRLLGKSQRLQRTLLQRALDSNRRSSMPLREFPSACHALRLLTPTRAATPRLNSLCAAIETRLLCILQSLCDFQNSLAPDRQTPLQDRDAWMLACASCAGSPTRNRDYASRQSLRTASRCQNMLAPDRKYDMGPLVCLGACLESLSACSIFCFSAPSTATAEAPCHCATFLAHATRSAC